MQEVMEPILQIQVLGKFTLRYGETVISDEDDRSRKVWAVLAYLIYHREKIISQQELVDLCWGEDTRSSDPHNALKSVIHRIRATLDKLQEGLGRTLLRRKAGCYIWNTDVPLEVDAEVFDTLCSRGAALEGDERLDAYQQALALYFWIPASPMAFSSWPKNVLCSYLMILRYSFAFKSLSSTRI